MKSIWSVCLSVLTGLSFGAWAVSLWLLSSIPGHEVHLPSLPAADKFAHFSYFLLGGLLLASLLRSTLRWQGWKLTCSVLFAIAFIGALDEFHQLYTPGRSGADLADWITDCAGGALSIVVIGWLYVRAKERRPRAASEVVAHVD